MCHEVTYIWTESCCCCELTVMSTYTRVAWNKEWCLGCWYRWMDSRGPPTALQWSIPSSRLKLSGSPDIVFLRLTFLGRRDTVSVLMRERRMLACRSNTAPGGREGESKAGGHTGRQHSVSQWEQTQQHAEGCVLLLLLLFIKACSVTRAGILKGPGPSLYWCVW